MAEFKGKLIEAYFSNNEKDTSVLFLILTHQMDQEQQTFILM